MLGSISSKEQELEQRALLLKRLAFVIFCSEVDQYQKQMPEIQGDSRYIFISPEQTAKLTAHPIFRATCGEPSHNPEFPRGPERCLPVLQNHSRPHVRPARHLPVAADHNGNGPNLLLP